MSQDHFPPGFGFFGPSAASPLSTQQAANVAGSPFLNAQRIFSMEYHNNSATRNVGAVVVEAFPGGAGSYVDDAAGLYEYRRLATGVAIGNTAEATISAASFVAALPFFRMVFRLPAIITQRFFAVMYTGGHPQNLDVQTAAGLFFIGIRFSSVAGDVKFTAFTYDGTALSQALGAQLLTVVAGRKYIIEITILSTVLAQIAMRDDQGNTASTTMVLSANFNSAPTTQVSCDGTQYTTVNSAVSWDRALMMMTSGAGIL